MTDANYTTLVQKLTAFFNTYLIPTLMWVAILVFVVLGIIAGIRWANAKTDEEKQKAKKTLIGLGVGIVITVVAAWAIPLLVNFLQTFFAAGDIPDPTGG